MNTKTKPKILCIFGNYFNWDNIAYIDFDNRMIRFNCCGQYAGLSYKEFDGVSKEAFKSEVNKAIAELL
jgi:hypothetical protein